MFKWGDRDIECQASLPATLRSAPGCENNVVAPGQRIWFDKHVFQFSNAIRNLRATVMMLHLCDLNQHVMKTLTDCQARCALERNAGHHDGECFVDSIADVGGAIVFFASSNSRVFRGVCG